MDPHRVVPHTRGIAMGPPRRCAPPGHGHGTSWSTPRSALQATVTRLYRCIRKVSGNPPNMQQVPLDGTVGCFTFSLGPP